MPIRNNSFVCLEMCWEKKKKTFPSKRWHSRWAHTESAANIPLVTEQITESVHTTSLWPSWNGKSEKTCTCMYPDMSGKTLFTHKLVHAYPGVYVAYTSRQMYIQIHLPIQAWPKARLTRIICSAWCQTPAVTNFPTVDVYADLTLT